MFWIIPIVAFFATLLTFFCGFGLGTMLLAAMLWYFPPEIAVALTAIVHLVNSFSKSILNRRVNWSFVLRFGIASMFAAMVGSIILKKLVSISHAAYDLTTSNLTHPVSYLSCIIGLIMILVSLFELRLKNKNIDIPLWSGGLISGFMGGLSGHQGALRSAFLVNKITNVGEFVATTAFIGLLTDIARNAVYLTSINWDQLNLKLLVLTCAFAVIGVLFGTYLLKKLSINSIQQMVSAGIFLLGLSMMLGLI